MSAAGLVIAVALLVLLLVLSGQCSTEPPCNPTGPVPCASDGGAR